MSKKKLSVLGDVKLFDDNAAYTGEGTDFGYRMRLLMDELMKEASEKNIDLRQLQALLHGEIDYPISREIIKRKRI